MTESGKVFDAFRNCITEPKCRDCPWTECDTLKNRVVEIPIDLALAVMRMLKAQEPVEPYRDSEGTYYCGICMETVVGYKNVNTNEDIRLKNYCSKCGRKVKWE